MAASDILICNLVASQNKNILTINEETLKTRRLKAPIITTCVLAFYFIGSISFLIAESNLDNEMESNNKSITIAFFCVALILLLASAAWLIYFIVKRNSTISKNIDSLDLEEIVYVEKDHDEEEVAYANNPFPKNALVLKVYDKVGAGHKINLSWVSEPYTSKIIKLLKDGHKTSVINITNIHQKRDRLELKEMALDAHELHKAKIISKEQKEKYLEE